MVQTVFKQLEPSRTVAFRMLVKRVSRTLNLAEGQVTGALCYLLWHGQLMTDLGQLLFDQGSIVPGVQVWIGAKEGQNDTPTA